MPGRHNPDNGEAEKNGSLAFPVVDFRKRGQVYLLRAGSGAWPMHGSGAGRKRGQVHLLRGGSGAWPMRGSGACEAVGFGFDHGAEVVPASCALLLQVGADGFEIVVR